MSLAEETNNIQVRIDRGDISSAEVAVFLKFNKFRSNLVIKSVDFQSIMFGDAWSNPLVYTFDAYNKESYFEDCYFDLDGALYEAYMPVGVHVNNCHFNMTNFEYGVWNDFRWDCSGMN